MSDGGLCPVHRGEGVTKVRALHGPNLLGNLQEKRAKVSARLAKTGHSKSKRKQLLAEYLRLSRGILVVRGVPHRLCCCGVLLMLWAQRRALGLPGDVVPIICAYIHALPKVSLAALTAAIPPATHPRIR